MHPGSCISLCFFSMLCIVVPLSRAQNLPVILYFGDSITEGWIDGQLSPGDAYPSLTDSLLRAFGRTAVSIHSGRGGETTEDALFRIDTDVLQHRPAIVIIAFGSNDWYVWGKPPFRRVKQEWFERNLRLLIGKVRGVGAIPIILPPPIALEKRFYTFADSLLYVDFGGAGHSSAEYSNAAIRIAAANQALIVDASAPENRDAFTGSDGVHLSIDGHRHLAISLASLINRILDSTVYIEFTSDTDIYPMPYQRFIDDYVILKIALNESTRVEVSFYDTAGREIEKIHYFACSPGIHYLWWNGKNKNGTLAAAGVYTVRIRAGARYSLQQLIIL